MTRVFAFAMCLAGFAATMWVCTQDIDTLAAMGSALWNGPLALLAIAIAAQIAGLQLLYFQDRQDLLLRIARHRNRVRHALAQMWSIKPEHHGEAQTVWTSEQMERWGIILLGWGYAMRYLAWAMLFASGAAVIAYVAPWIVLS